MKTVVMGMVFDSDNVPDFGSIYAVKITNGDIKGVNEYGLNVVDVPKLDNITNAAYGSVAWCDDTGDKYRLTKAGWRKFGSAGGGGDSDSDGDSTVRFLDYDGTVLYSCTPEQFANFTEMPANPTHAGLTSQGWNYTIEDAQEYVADYGALDIGQMYITDDGKTRLYIKLEEGRLSPTLKIGLQGTCVVDWGDGSPYTTLIKNNTYLSDAQASHTYPAAGKYVIVLDVTGEFKFRGSYSGSELLTKTGTPDSNSRGYENTIEKIEIGQNVISMDFLAFSGFCSLVSITIPAGIGSIAFAAFQSCSSLRSVTLPNSIGLIEGSAFSGCYSLESVSLPNNIQSISSDTFSRCYFLTNIAIPNGTTSIGDTAFRRCYSLERITIPGGVTSMGNDVLKECYSLRSAIIGEGATSIVDNMFCELYTLRHIKIPGSITSIGRSFINCSRLTKIDIPYGVTSIAYNAFFGSSLLSVTIPDSVTSMGNGVFASCNNLKSATISRSLTSIADEMFFRASTLASITIPESVTSIGALAFNGCYGLGYIKFERTTPPSVANSNAWTNIPTDCKIYVPQGSLSAYTSAANYPSSSTYTYVEY